jgi:lipoate-protein ligase A
MKWYFINTGACTGKYNMDFDLHLANNSKPGEAVLRLYRWKPYCISLGANQEAASVNSQKAAEDNIDIVVRPTGGRAILHAEELTYSVILPLEEHSSARNIYNEINAALLKGLDIYDPGLAAAALENIQPDFASFYKQDISAVCFAASAKSEIKFTGKKLVGSAQRKLKKAVLQHGSVLCGDFHTQITRYLNTSAEGKEKIIETMKEKTTDIRTILGTEVDYNRLEKSLINGFESFFNMKIEEIPAGSIQLNAPLN